MKRILCAAIWYNDNEEHQHQPFNIKIGFVVAGRGHHNCLTTIYIIDPKFKDKKYRGVQGFITNDNLFVEREEAAIIAFDSGQINKQKSKLFSEDLF